MVYPPPPGLVFTAYMTGNITKAELERLMKLWNEKHKPSKEVSGDES